MNPDELFKKYGYSYKPHNGPSGRPRFFKDKTRGTIYFFPFNDKGIAKYHFLLRKVIKNHSEDVISEIIDTDRLEYWLKRAELFDTL